MSKTYKTSPCWVKVKDPRFKKSVSEYHDHSHGVCDIDEAVGDSPFYWQRSNGYCGYTTNYYTWNDGFYPRPISSRTYRKKFESRMRCSWRQAKHDMLKLSRDAIEDYDVKSHQHRHSALWETY
jgi:hypothetical protein